MAQKYKVEKVEALKEELKDYNSFIFTDFRGLDVQQINELRNSLRDKGAHYHVIKNRYAKRVFQDLGFDGMDQYLVNPTAIAYFEKNLSEIAKVLIDSAEETTLELKGGYSDGNVISSDELIKISKLPTRDVLLAQLLGMLNAPQRGLVTALHGILSKFVRTLKAVQEVKPVEGAEPKTEAKAEVTKEAEAKAEAEAGVKEEAKPEVEAKSEVKKESKPEVEAKSEVKKESKPEAEAKAEVKKESKPKAEAKAEVKKEAKPKAEAKAEVKKEAKPEAEAKAEVKKEAKPKAEAKAEVKKEAKPKAEAKTKETKAAPEEKKSK